MYLCMYMGSYIYMSFIITTRCVCWVTRWAGCLSRVVLLYVCIIENCKCTGHDNKNKITDILTDIIITNLSKFKNGLL